MNFAAGGGWAALLRWWLPLGVVAGVLVGTVVLVGAPVQVGAAAHGWTRHLPPALVAHADLLALAAAATLCAVSLVLGLRAWHRASAVRAARNHRSLARLTWREFEVLVAELYRRQGYAASATPDGADGGVDVLVESRHGRTIVQAKHWPHRTVGVAVVRELYALLDDFDADSGAVVTSGRLSPEARAFAAEKPVTLIDGDAVVALARALRRRPARLTSELDQIKQEWSDYCDEGGTETPSSAATIVCPHCATEIEVEYRGKG